jgi:hypothetical protein
MDQKAFPDVSPIRQPLVPKQIVLDVPVASGYF